MSARKSTMGILVSTALFMFANQSHSDTLFYVPYDKNLEAEISAGKAAPLGVDTAVVSVFAETTQNNKGIVRNGESQAGEALDLSGPNSNRSVNYESTSNFNPEQGTIQFWVKPLFDTLPMRSKDDKRNFFYIKTEGGDYNGISIGFRDWFYNGKPSSPILYFYINDGKHHGIQVNLGKNNDWEKGKWQHIMACWDKKSMRLYLNGKLLGKGNFNEKDEIKPCMPGGPIEIGKTESSNFPCLIDELTIDNGSFFSEETAFFELSQLPRPEKKMNEGSQYYPTLPSFVTATAPKIDGKLEDPEWKKAIWLTGFATLSSNLNFVKVQTLMASCYDKDNLYLAFVCIEPYMDKIYSEKRPKDGPVWKDESIEFFVCPDKNNRNDLYQFIVNASGSLFDGKYRDNGKWNGEWTAATFKHNDRWTMEIAIPWKTIGIKAPQEGEEIPFNGARNRRLPGGDESCIALVAYPSYYVVNRYGNIKFVKNPTDAGTEKELNSFFTNTTGAICGEFASTIDAQIKNCEFLWGTNPKIDGLRAKFQKWNNLNTKKLTECVQKYLEIPIIQTESFNVLNAIKEEHLTKNILSPGKDEHVLAKKSGFVISRKNGVLLGIIDDKQVLSSSITDKFSFENKNGEKKNTDEWFDVIVDGSLKADGKSLEGIFTNEKLEKIKIKKTYTLIDDTTISKRVEFSQSGGDEYKISGYSEVAINEAFRNGGIYSSYPSAMGNKEKYLIGADEIKKSQAVPLRVWISTFGKALVNFTNKDSSKGIGQFQKSINDGFAYPPLGFDMTYLTASGWQLSWFCGSLGKDIRATSSEACYTVFNGDRINFHMKYKDIIALEHAWDGWVPLKWIDNVRWIDTIAWAHEVNAWKNKFEQKAKTLRDFYNKEGRSGDSAIVLARLTHRWGALPVSGDSLISYSATLSQESTCKAELYAGPYQKLHDDPRLLAGIYMWPWGIHKGVTGMENKHPEWFVHNRDGNLLVAMTQFANGSTTEHVPMFTADYDKWWVDNCMGMVDYMKVRMFYTDGPLMTAPVIDWGTMKIRTQNDGLKLAKLLSAECRKRNVLWFANDGYTMTPFKDISWMESVETLLDNSSWKSSAEPFLTASIYSHEDVPQFMIYWRDTNRVHYSNIVLLLGLRASHAHFDCPDKVQEHYVQIGQEMFGYRTVFPDLKPCYWTENTTVEAYALKKKNADGLLVTVENHKATNDDVTLSFDAEKAGLDIAKPVYGWYSNTRGLDALIAKPDEKLFDFEDIANRISTQDKRISITVKNLAPEIAQQIYLTNIPAFIWEIEGKSTLLKASSVLKTQISRITDGELLVSSDRSASILHIKQNISKILIDGKESALSEVTIGTTKCLIFKVPAGEHNIKIISR